MYCVTISSSGESISLQKVVITTFLSPDSVEHYIEVCGLGSPVYFIELNSTFVGESLRQFYLDEDASRAMVKSYELLDEKTGLHRQKIGSDTLEVSPVSSTLELVSTPSTEASKFRIDVPDVTPNSWGLWMKFCASQQPTSGWSSRSKRSWPEREMHAQLRTEGVSIKNFYWFLVIPKPYQAIDESMTFGGASRSLQGKAPKSEAVMEFVLPDDFAVYPEWRSAIFGRSILKNRRVVSLSENAVLDFSYRLVDLGRVARVAVRAYAAGLAVALAGSALTSAVGYGADHAFTWRVNIVVAVLAAVVVLAAALGWRSIERHRSP